MRIEIEKLVFGGYGMGRIEGKAVFVPYSVPGDIVDVEVTERHSAYDRARIVEIIKPSDARVEPPCSFFGRCGGCHLQHMNYAAQIHWKQLILAEQLSRIAGAGDAVILPTVPSRKVWGYRNRIRLHKMGKKIGYYEKGSHRIIEIDRCMIADGDVNRNLHKMIEDAGPFEQVNPYANCELKKLVCDWAGEGAASSVVELYAGSGNLTFEIAKIAAGVVAVEADKAAVKRAKGEAKKHGLGNIEFMCGRAEDMSFGGRSFDLVVADPPREGLGGGVIKKIVGLWPVRVIYVSCDPATLARDARALAKGGYGLQKAQPLDMFPQTYHIESVSCFVRA